MVKKFQMTEENSFLNYKIDFNSPNKNIIPISTKVDQNGKLTIGECSIEDLVEKFGSPPYCVSS